MNKIPSLILMISSMISSTIHSSLYINAFTPLQSSSSSSSSLRIRNSKQMIHHSSIKLTERNMSRCYHSFRSARSNCPIYTASRSNKNHGGGMTSSTTTELSMKLSSAMVPTATTSGASALLGAVSGGVLGGALHAIAGPDHLAALLPRCCGQTWYRAGRIGALWGMGHGVSATLLGLTAFGLKNRISTMPQAKIFLIGASSAMEIAVGVSLILIGLLGMKEAREFGKEEDDGLKIQSESRSIEQIQSLQSNELLPNSFSNDHLNLNDGVDEAQKRAVIFNGILHGFSWDGAPSLAPAVAVATWRGSISFLLAYALGTVGAMSITTTLIGESTRRAGKILNLPDLPKKLSFFSSILAMGVGVFWCYLAFK